MKAYRKPRTDREQCSDSPCGRKLYICTYLRENPDQIEGLNRQLKVQAKEQDIDTIPGVNYRILGYWYN